MVVERVEVVLRGRKRERDDVGERTGDRGGQNREQRIAEKAPAGRDRCTKPWRQRDATPTGGQDGNRSQAAERHGHADPRDPLERRQGEQHHDDLEPREAVRAEKKGNQ